MANINANTMNNSFGAAQTHVAPEIVIKQPAKPVISQRDTQKKLQDAASKAAKDAKTQEYGPVIATSEDGDTVRIKISESEIAQRQNSYSFKEAFESARDDMQDFSIPKATTHISDDNSEAAKSNAPEASKPAFEPATPNFDIPLEIKKPAIEETGTAEEKVDTSSAQAWTPKPTTLAGFTEAQLRKMLKNGEVSQNKYQNELNSRAEAKETSEEINKNVSNEVANDVVKLSEMENKDKALDLLENGEDQTLSPEQRAEILQSVQDQAM